MTEEQQPSRIVHPGVIIEREMEARGWGFLELERESGVRFFKLYDVVRLERPVTPFIAAGLARAFGTSAELWTNMQASYDEARKRK